MPVATMTGLYDSTSLSLQIPIVKRPRRDRCIAELWCCRGADHSILPIAEMLPVFLATVHLLIVTFVTSQGQFSFCRVFGRLSTTTTTSTEQALKWNIEAEP